MSGPEMRTRHVPLVLLIDDNEIDREAVFRLMKDEIAFIAAGTADEGLTSYDQNRPDCVLLDYWLPDAEGVEMLRELVVREAAVIVLTGQGSESIAVEAMKSGAQDYLVKGALDAELLRRAVNGAIARRSLQTALGQSQDYNRALLDAIPDMIARIRRDGTYLDFIAGEAAGAHLPAAEFLGRTVHDVHPADIADSLLRRIEQAISSRDVQELEYVLDIAGMKRTYEARITVCGEGEVVAITRDVTRQRSLEQRMRASQRMEAVGRMASGIAHDFNNVLTLIQGYTGLLLEEFDDTTRVHKDLSVMWDASERGAKLIRQLLAFSRKQAQQLEILDLNQEIRDLAKILGRLVTEHIELIMDLDGELGSIRADSTQLDQILMNLVVNARDAMPQGGTLTISTRNAALDESAIHDTRPDISPGRYVVLRVEDTGIGMDQETQSRIFEPFFTTKSHGRGTGLGLATVYGVVQQSGGFIEVRSEPGKGAAFEICLPLVDDQPVESRPRRRVSVSLTGSETILLVEDEESVRRAIHGILERNGYIVLEAAQGSEALALCLTHEGTIDLLLTDVVMPHITGLDLAGELTSHLPALQVLYMTGYPDEALHRHGLDSQLVPLLEKPFTPESLLRKVREVLDERGPQVRQQEPR
jgi:signal transduction histidine kinase